MLERVLRIMGLAEAECRSDAADHSRQPEEGWGEVPTEHRGRDDPEAGYFTANTQKPAGPDDVCRVSRRISSNPAERMTCSTSPGPTSLAPA